MLLSLTSVLQTRRFYFPLLMRLSKPVVLLLCVAMGLEERRSPGFAYGAGGSFLLLEL